TRRFGRAIARWVLNRNRVLRPSDVAIEQLIFDMAVALPNSSTRSVPRVGGSFKRALRNVTRAGAPITSKGELPFDRWRTQRRADQPLVRQQGGTSTRPFMEGRADRWW